LIPRNPRSKHGPQQQVLRGPIKSVEQPIIGPRPPLGTVLFVKQQFLIGVKFRSFHWTTLMQDRWILQARATNAILYDCIRVILFLYGERIQHRSTTEVWPTGVQGCEPPWQDKCKNRAPICLYFDIQYFFGFQ